MAGQLILTKGPERRADCRCSNLAMISFPVPLSPRIRTGTVASAIRSILARISRMRSEPPKTTNSGGNSGRIGFGVATASSLFGGTAQTDWFWRKLLGERNQRDDLELCVPVFWLELWLV